LLGLAIVGGRRRRKLPCPAGAGRVAGRPWAPGWAARRTWRRCWW